MERLQGKEGKCASVRTVISSGKRAQDIDYRTQNQDQNDQHSRRKNEHPCGCPSLIKRYCLSSSSNIQSTLSILVIY